MPVIYVGERLVKGAARLDPRTVHQIFQQFVEQQVLRPEYFKTHKLGVTVQDKKARRLLHTMLQDVWDMRAGL